MIPNNPNMSIHTDYLETLSYTTDIQHPINEEVYGVGVGGSNLDSPIGRKNLTNWYTSPEGVGANLDTVFKLYKEEAEGWVYIESYDSVFTDTSLISRVRLTFDRLNKPFIAWQDELGSSLCWLDPRTGNRQTLQIPGAYYPLLVLDALYDIRHPHGEVVLAYISSDGDLQLRWESEYFEIEHNTGLNLPDYYLVSGGMTKDTRQLQFSTVLSTDVLPTVEEFSVLLDIKRQAVQSYRGERLIWWPSEGYWLSLNAFTTEGNQGIRRIYTIDENFDNEEAYPDPWTGTYSQFPIEDNGVLSWVGDKFIGACYQGLYTLLPNMRSGSRFDFTVSGELQTVRGSCYREDTSLLYVVLQNNVFCSLENPGNPDSEPEVLFTLPEPTMYTVAWSGSYWVFGHFSELYFMKFTEDGEAIGDKVYLPDEYSGLYTLTDICPHDGFWWATLQTRNSGDNANDPVISRTLKLDGVPFEAITNYPPEPEELTVDIVNLQNRKNFLSVYSLVNSPSTDGVTYLWELPDGSTSTFANFQVYLAEEVDVEVTLTVTQGTNSATITKVFLMDTSKYDVYDTEAYVRTSSQFSDGNTLYAYTVVQGNQESSSTIDGDYYTTEIDTPPDMDETHTRVYNPNNPNSGISKYTLVEHPSVSGNGNNSPKYESYSLNGKWILIGLSSFLGNLGQVLLSEDGYTSTELGFVQGFSLTGSTDFIIKGYCEGKYFAKVDNRVYSSIDLVNWNKEDIPELETDLWYVQDISCTGSTVTVACEGGDDEVLTGRKFPALVVSQDGGTTYSATYLGSFKEDGFIGECSTAPVYINGWWVLIGHASHSSTETTSDDFVARSRDLVEWEFQHPTTGEISEETPRVQTRVLHKLSDRVVAYMRYAPFTEHYSHMWSDDGFTWHHPTKFDNIYWQTPSEI